MTSRGDRDDSGGPPAPRIWLLLSDKLGDNAQVLRVAEALGWPYETRRIVPKRIFRTGKPWVTASLYHVDKARSDPLQPPWPDLILTIGRRPSMAALWIKKQSGGRSRIVMIGRPRRLLDRFDLVVTSSHYRLPEEPNVLRLDLPLLGFDEAKVAAAADSESGRFAALPRPLTALMVGGPTGPMVLDAQIAERLARDAGRASVAAGGSLYVTTSRRTPPAVVEALRAALPPDAQLYRWRPDAEDNPYLALLAQADRFIVTGDSISMMVEIARLGKPLAIYPLPVSGKPLDRVSGWLGPLIHDDPARGVRAPLRSLGGLLYRLGLAGYSRDLEALHGALIERGAAVRLGDPWPPAGPGLPDEVPGVVARVRSLLGEGHKA